MLAMSLEDLAHHFFGFAQGVHIGGVDEVATLFLRIGHHRSRIFQRCLVTKHHGAQTQAGNFQGAFAQSGEFHGVL